MKILCFLSKGSLNIPEYRCLLIGRVQYVYTIEHAIYSIYLLILLTKILSKQSLMSIVLMPVFKHSRLNDFWEASSEIINLFQNCMPDKFAFTAFFSTIAKDINQSDFSKQLVTSFWLVKELSFCHKLWFSNFYNLTTRFPRP